MKRPLPDPSLPVQRDLLMGYTYGEQAMIRRARRQWLKDNPPHRDAGPRGTCQICERDIGVGAGVIAHHGYTRPLPGHQTKSCYGARYAPWERERSRLGEWIEVCARERDMHARHAEAIAAEERAIAFHYRLPAKQRRSALYAKHDDGRRSTWVTRESFSWAQAFYLAHVDTPRFAERPLTWEEARDDAVASARRNAAQWESERQRQQARYDEWKPKESGE